MAKQRQSGAVPSSTNTFEKGVISDIKDRHLPSQYMTFARNAINKSHIGDLGNKQNEPGNKFCTAAPYTIIGALHRVAGLWTIFSTNDVDSEIGIFDEDTCEYTTKVNDRCLNFKTIYLIKGATRPTFDCGFRDYWADGFNPDRTINLDTIPWVQDCTDSNGDDPGGCITCVDTDVLDCDKIRLETYIQTPCLHLSKSGSAGNILNGSYIAVIAYTINGQRMTDYFTRSNVLSLFSFDDVNSSITVELSNLDTNFDEYELVIISTIAEKTTAYKVGLYSTNQTIVSLDVLFTELEAVPLVNIPIMNPIADKSDAIYNVGKYLFRSSVTTKFDFNYQPLANQIRALWQVIEYPKDYYKEGGTNVGYPRDENMSFFLRFIYTTGDKTKIYHIPGRGPRAYLLPTAVSVQEDDDYLTVEVNNLEEIAGLTAKVFERFNTASLNATPGTVLADGGIVTAEGDMGYHQSSEFYDDKHPEIWNSDVLGRPDWDLCGKPIRHHKFPENTIYANGGVTTSTNHFVDGGNKIRIMGVRFENIQPPVDNNGVPIPGIVGYEILRGSRDGNKTVLYKGIINNMFEYDIPDTISNRTGLYQNYPYNDLNPDPFISTTEVSFETIGGLTNYNPNDQYSKKHFTFHSPDTMFYKPFLGQREFKISGAVYGNTEGSWVEVDNHPKHKFITDVTFAVSVVIGIGYAIMKTIGKKSITHQQSSHYSEPIFAGDSTSIGTSLGAATAAGMTAAWTAAEAFSIDSGLTPIVAVVTGVDGVETTYTTIESTIAGLNATPGSGVRVYAPITTYEDKSPIPTILRIAQASYLFATYVAEGSDLTMKIIKAVSKWRQFALQYQSHCGYENFRFPDITNHRRLINDMKYLDSKIQDYGTAHKVNNLLRNRTVMFDTASDVDNVPAAISDNSRDILPSSLPGSNAFQDITRRASSHYGAMKTRMRNQYGQLRSIKTLPVSECYTPIAESGTGTLFGGDTYIGRYQEKNTLYYFYKWLLNEANGTEFNYHMYDMIRHTAFWMDTEEFDTMEFVQSIGPAIQSAITAGDVTNFFQNLVSPSDKHCFDRLSGGNGLFMVKNAFMFLFNSGVRDFFVESELNIDYRDHGNTDATKHWSVMEDLRSMFHSSIIEAGNYYKLDRSLSVGFLPANKISWATMQDANYDPTKAETCYTYLDKRVIYSLPQDIHATKDNWSVFLANNYQDFLSKITGIKQINLSGAIFLFERHGPGLFPGVDELQLKSGTSITVGDGGLFMREMQQLSNADKPYEYGSCQSRLSIINTPFGTFFASLEQGCIFQVGEGLNEISLNNNTYWFDQYLPYRLLEDFPNFDVLDNPVAGIGVQFTYDPHFKLIYFCKKDYRIKPIWKDKVVYVGKGEFLVDNIARIKTGDPRYFDNASWTISWDPQEKGEVSWHDWHPDLILPTKNGFVTTKGAGLWKHNERCDLYCNYYNKDYPFEVEFQFDNMPAVTTVRNVEYWMQVFKFMDNCRDRFHVLDFNFDEAVVYNSEQVSGVLKLNLQPHNDIRLEDTYPIVQPNQIQILYSKEEQKYRFNQFWDIIRDRGEFSPLAQDTIWITEENGYIKNINPAAVNYAKAELQTKKFRHNNNRIILRRLVCGDKKMIIAMVETKLQISPR
jgi:hypothetical protein